MSGKAKQVVQKVADKAKRKRRRKDQGTYSPGNRRIIRTRSELEQEARDRRRGISYGGGLSFPILLLDE